MSGATSDADPQRDERAIRALVAQWIDAARRGDVDAQLALLADDVVFLVAGRAPFGKDEFAAQARAQAAPDAPRMRAEARVEEVVVHDDLAFARVALQVEVRARDGAVRRRAGQVLDVYRRGPDGWRVLRDANLLAPEDA